MVVLGACAILYSSLMGVLIDIKADSRFLLVLNIVTLFWLLVILFVGVK